MASDLLIPCRHELIREAMADWCGPVWFGGLGSPGVWDGFYARESPHAKDGWGTRDLRLLQLDLARPEVRDFLARALAPWRSALDGDVVWWLRRIDVDESAALHPRILYLLRLVDIARAAPGPDPQPGKELALRKMGVGSWGLYTPQGIYVFSSILVDAPTGHRHIPALAGITDPAEAARVIWEDICK